MKLDDVLQKNKIPISLLKMEEQRLSTQWMLKVKWPLNMNPARNKIEAEKEVC